MGWADCRRYLEALAGAINEDPTKVPKPIEPDLLLCARTPESAVLLLAYLPRDTPQNILESPYSLFEGIIARWQGDAPRAKALQALSTEPDNSQWVSTLGIIDAGLGNKADALAEGHRACELAGATKTPILSRIATLSLANIEAWTGEKAAALDHLETLRDQTCNGYEYGLLKLSPTRDPLRGEPRFEAQLASLAPKTDLLGASAAKILLRKAVHHRSAPYRQIPQSLKSTVFLTSFRAGGYRINALSFVGFVISRSEI